MSIRTQAAVKLLMIPVGAVIFIVLCICEIITGKPVKFGQAPKRKGIRRNADDFPIAPVQHFDAIGLRYGSTDKPN